MTTPVCPACGAKFSHSNAMLACIKCRLPDEIALQGSAAIHRWKVEVEMAKRGISKKAAERTLEIHGGSAGRRRNKHGRRGVAR